MIEKINLIIGPEKGASPHLSMATKYQWYNYRGQVRITTTKPTAVS
jgi:hypothetical protein